MGITVVEQKIRLTVEQRVENRIIHRADVRVTRRDRVVVQLVGVQGPPGPAGVSSVQVFSAENLEGSTIPAGVAVAPASASAGLRRASSTDPTRRPVVGLAAASASPGAPLSVQLTGPLELSNWSAALASGNALLARKTEYFIDGNGKLTPVAPVANAGEAIISAGTSLSTTTLAVEIDHRGTA